MIIANQHDLRIAHFILSVWKGTGQGNSEAAIALKRNVREFSARPVRHIICDEGLDGYIEIERLPEWADDLSREEVEGWFDECRVVETISSPYDCTGGAFTRWYKLTRRRGSWYAYHAIGYDV